jgi:hypothetical protein
MTVMTPVINSLQQHIAATTASEPVSPDDVSFRQEVIPQLSGKKDTPGWLSHLLASLFRTAIGQPLAGTALHRCRRSLSCGQV